MSIRNRPPLAAALSRYASDVDEQKDALAVFVLLEFLLGSSIRDLRAHYHLESDTQAEELVRLAILKSGYDAHAEEPMEGLERRTRV